MITDEMILKIHQDTAKHGGIVEFARDLIAMAQEVRPLVFAQSGVSSKTANTNYGPYSICNFIDELRAAFPEDKYYARFFESEAEAIAAAQADFNRRVLENLTHGGRNET